MKEKLLYLFLFFSLYGFSQWSVPPTMNQFCAGGSSLVFPNVGNGFNAGNMGEVDCLGSTPNPSWYFIQVATSGNLIFNISQVTDTGSPIDVDFALWGPFSTIDNAISAIQANPENANLIDCSYSPLAEEVATIPNAQTGQIYVFLMTNYEGSPGQISLTQMSGSGSTSCDFACGVSIGYNVASCLDSHLLEAEFNATFSDVIDIVFQWTHNGNILPETSSTLLVTEDGEYTVVAHVESCTEPATATVNVTLNRQIPFISFDDKEVCEGSSVNFSSLISQLIRQYSDDGIDIKLFATQDDAELNQNAMANNFIAESSQTIYVRIFNAEFPQCYLTTSFELIVHPNPEILNIEDNYQICKGDTITLINIGEFDSYFWSDGSTASTFTITQAGDYSLTVTDGICTATKHFSVEESEPATIVDVKVVDFSLNQNTIEVTAQGIGDYEYSINGVQYQDSPVFGNVDSGMYMVSVRDKKGCGVVSQSLMVLMYPKFFTPNGDGFNDFWQIKYAFVEPNMQLFIFDRFGKLIHFFKGRDRGWDGTYNGKKLPSTDYWFVIKRESGQEIKGHFSMLR